MTNFYDEINFSNVSVAQQQIQTMIFNKHISSATEVLAEHLKQTHFFKSIRNDKDKEIWIYKEGIYLPEGQSYIIEESRKYLGILFTTYIGNQIITKIWADTFIEQKDFFDQQNNFPYLIPVMNGLLNLKTKQLEKFTPFKFFFTKLKLNYNPSKDCLKIKEFVKQITKKEEDRKTIQEIFGFCLVKEYKFEKGIMLYGERGRNGKSKLLSLLQAFLHPSNCANVSLQEIEKEPFCLVNLHNKLVNVSADISNQAINATGTYKALTGRDVINANRKGRSYIQFVNYAKMIFSCNELPMINTLSQAFWLRWVVIDFPYQFLPQKEIDSMEDTTNTFLQNENILEDLTSDDELSGLLNWAIEGLHRLEKNKSFSNEKSSSSVKKYWLRKSNSVAAFIEDVITTDYDSNIPKHQFRKVYHDYCKTNNLKQVSEKSIKITLQNELGLSERYIQYQGGQVWCWEGIKFKDLIINNTDIVLNYLKKEEQAKPKELIQLFGVGNEDKLLACLKALEQEGEIIELPRGVWRLKQ